MTEAQKKFCDEYLIDLNGTRAYRKAYKGCKSEEAVRANASRMLTKDNIKAYIKERQKEIEERTEITQDMVVKELAKIAFLDIKKIFNESGGLKNIQDIESNTTGAITMIESFEEFEGYGEDREKTGDIRKIKFSDKTKALELLGRHLGMFKDKVTVSGSINTYDTSKMTDEQLNKLLEKAEKNE